MKKRPGDSCKVGRPQLRTAGVAGWVVIKAPFARQLLSLRRCASLAVSEIIHEGAERAGPGKAGTANLTQQSRQVQGAQPTLRRETGTPAGHLLPNRVLISGHVQPSRCRAMISRSSSVEARESTFSSSSEKSGAFGRRAFQISRSRSSRDFFSRRREHRSRIHSSRAVVAITLCTHASTSSLTSLLSSRIEGVRGTHAGGCRLVPVLAAFRGSLPVPA